MTDMDRKLLASARNGDVEAYEKITGTWHKKVYNIILNSCGRDTDVSELTQEVFVRVFKTVRASCEEPMLPVLIVRTAGEVCKKAKL
ncbi:MAG: hypothetical protein HGA22_00520 [Clostridiales bacterium]|nr:hypothetical protein [Clostridiales bacterium]